MYLKGTVNTMLSKQAKCLIAVQPTGAVQQAKKPKTRKVKTYAEVVKTGLPKVVVQSAPIARSALITTGKPKIVPAKHGGTIVRNREYYTDLTGATSDTKLLSVQVNAANPTLFAWLSTVARNYESYRFKKLSFQYEPLCSTAHAGAIFMAMDYDATDTDATSRQQLMSYEGAVRSAVWQRCSLNCNRMNNTYPKHYTSQQPPPTGTDAKTYNVGNFQVWTTGSVNTQINGEIYIDYEVELFVPQTQNFQQIVGPYSQEVTSTPSGSPTGGAPLGITPDVASTLCTASGSAIGEFTKAGRYLVSMLANGAFNSGGASTSNFTPRDSNIQVVDAQQTTTSGVSMINAVIDVLRTAVVLKSYIDWTITGGSPTVSNSYAKIAPYPWS